MVSHRQRRKMIMNEILNTAKKSFAVGSPLPKEELIACVCLEYGCGRKTVLEYLRILITAKRLKEEWTHNNSFLVYNKEIEIEV